MGRGLPAQRGFTLIELSIVLVIIGLIVGGVLVGQDLIRAAEVRATISQIEKYNTAVNTFRGKYDALPGDIKDPEASNFGFAARGAAPGEGDGNGLIEGNFNNSGGTNFGSVEAAGETAMFWEDLSAAHLIEGNFRTASPTTQPGLTVTVSSSPALKDFFPEAKLGNGNFFVVWSGTITGTAGANYWSLAGITNMQSLTWADLASYPALTVSQAYSIDKKLDDGLPQSGNVTAQYMGNGPTWAPANLCYPNLCTPYTTATPGDATTCFDNGNVGGAAQHYSVTQNGGAGVNCGLSFEFQ